MLAHKLQINRPHYQPFCTSAILCKIKPTNPDKSAHSPDSQYIRMLFDHILDPAIVPPPLFSIPVLFVNYIPVINVKKTSV